MNCIFCGIVNGNIPSRRIYENEYTFAFLDIADDVDGHTIVIPKKHINSILDCDISILVQLMKTVKIISNHYVDNCGYQGVNLLNASGIAAQQSVPHFHIHIIPRMNNDEVNAWPFFKGAKQSADEILQLLKIY